MKMMRNRGGLVSLLVAAMTCAGALQCATRTPHRPNVILISIDTLRADHLGCYGYGRGITPGIDSFRHDAVLFETAISSAPSTLPSHASMFTSLPPQHHGASFQRHTPLAPQFVTIAEVMKRAGYRTMAFVGGGQLATEYGLDQGFDTYDVLWLDMPFAQEVDRALASVRDDDEKPFFMFLHTYQIHMPYLPAPEDLRRLEPQLDERLPMAALTSVGDHLNNEKHHLTAEEIAHMRNAYDAEIMMMDRGISRLVAELRRRGLYDDTIIVFTADHGEEFGEHGAVALHSRTFFEELLHVPLILKLTRQQQAGLAVEGMVRTVDIAPMIVDLAGVEPEPQFQKFNVRTALKRGRTATAPAVLWRESPEVDLEGLRTDQWMLAEGQLFDVVHDRAEKINVASEHPDVTNALGSELRALLSSRPRPNTPQSIPSPETLRNLHALGYLR